MDILKNRPLFFACMLYIVCAFFAYFATPFVKVALLGISLAALLLCAVCLSVRRLSRRTVLFFGALALSAFLAFGTSTLAFGAALRDYERIAKLESCEISATVTERTESETMSVYRVRVHTVDDEKYYFDATVVCYFAAYLQVGDRFDATAKPLTLRESASPQYGQSYALANGLRMQFDIESEQQIRHVRQNTTPMPMLTLTRLNDTLCRALLDVCGEESGGVVCALLLGDRGHLQGTLARDFERAGASHMLALSGMHVSILMGAIGFLLTRLRMHRKARAVLLALAAIGYLLLTGFSVSATRAVFMVCMLQLSYLLATDNDTLTTLGLAGALILLFDPYSVCDVGFILSFLATFGIVVLVPPLHAYLDARTKLLCTPPHQKLKVWVLGIARSVLEALLIGVIACFAILVPSCFFIGNISLFSPITTLLLSPIVAALLILGAITLLLCPIPPLANLFATLIRLLYAVMTPYLSFVSGIDGALLPLTHTFVRVVAILLCGTMMILLLLPLRRKLLLALPPAALIFCLGIFYPVHAALQAHTLHAAYTHPSSVSETLVSTDGFRAYICDLSTGSGKATLSAMQAAQNLHATEVGAILLTDCNATHAAMLTDLFKSCKVDCLLLPRTTDRDLLDVQARLCEVADMYGTEVAYYDFGTAIAWGDGTVLTVHSTRISRSEQPVLTIVLQKDDAQICAFNANAQHSEIAAQSDRALILADVAICMQRGPVPRLPYTIEQAQGGKVVFATKELASYCDPDSLEGVHDMTVCPEIAYFSLASKQEP